MASRSGWYDGTGLEEWWNGVRREAGERRLEQSFVPSWCQLFSMDSSYFVPEGENP